MFDVDAVLCAGGGMRGPRSHLPGRHRALWQLPHWRECMKWRRIQSGWKQEESGKWSWGFGWSNTNNRTVILLLRENTQVHAYDSPRSATRAGSKDEKRAAWPPRSHHSAQGRSDWPEGYFFVSASHLQLLLVLNYFLHIICVCNRGLQNNTHPKQTNQNKNYSSTWIRNSYSKLGGWEPSALSELKVVNHSKYFRMIFFYLKHLLLYHKMFYDDP